MKPEEARILLQKYFEGETTLEEEKSLKSYFLQEEVSGELLPYRKWFTAIGEPAPVSGKDPFAEEMERYISEHRKPVISLDRKLILTFSGIAASVIIVVGSLLFYLSEPTYRDTFSDPVQARAYAEKTLAFVSAKYNRGLAALEPAGKLRTGQEKLGKNMKTIRKGFTEINKIQVFNKLKVTD